MLAAGTLILMPLGLGKERAAAVGQRDGDEVHGRRSDEARDELVLGLGVDLHGLAHLLDPAVLHDHDPRPERHRLDLVVGDVDRRGLETLVEALQLDAHLHAQLGVEVRQRLVEQEHLRVPHDGAAHGDALALAARELARLALEQLLDAEYLGGVLDALLDLRLGKLPHLEAEGHVVVHAHVRVQSVVLEHHGDVAVLGRQIVDDPVADGDLAGGDLLETCDHAERRGLAAARRPDEDHELLVADRQVDVLDGVHLVVLLVELPQHDLRHERPRCAA